MSGILGQLGIAEELQSNTPAMSSIAPSAGPPIVFTITFASAHGLLAQDTITISGATPATYNGTWTILDVPSTTTARVVTPTLLAANTVVGTYVAGIYGRGPTVTRFYDLVSEGVELDSAPIESNGLRSGNKVLRGDKWAVNRKGAGGPIVLEVQVKQFGLILKHLMGAIATTGPTDSAFTHTATIGPMVGKSLIAQIGRAMTQSQVVQPFTYPGVKITEWELSCDVDGILILSLTVDAQDEQYTVLLAAASYPSSSDLLTFAGGVVNIGGAAVDVSKFSLKCNMGYKSDRRFLRGSTLQREPAEGPMREFTFDLTAEFTDMTQYNRYASATRAGRLAALSAVFTGPTLIGAATFPSLTVTAPQARFDGKTPKIDGPDLIPLPLSGKLLNSPGGTNDACSLAYVTADSTP